MSQHRYESYKDSGNNWLGEVPRTWQVTRLKHVVSAPITDGPHETPEFLNEGVPFISAEAVASGEINFDKIRGYISPAYNAQCAKKYQPQLHDIYMVKSGATTGVVALVRDRTDFNIWSPLAAIRCAESVHPFFVFYFLRSRNFQEAVSLNWSFGTQQNIGMNVIGNMACILPPFFEQVAIATFLDHETAKIDALVAGQQRLIALLKEKRQAVVSHAVTKGLDPDAQMKDSGVEWLREVPAHWNVLRFQHCVSISEGQVNPEIDPYANMILIAPNHVESCTGRILALETATNQGAESGKYLCNAGEVVYSKIRPALRKACIAPIDCLCSADMYPLNGQSGLSNDFLYWFILSEVFSCLAILESQRVAMPKINRESLKDVRIAFPPALEQLEIVSYLRSETLKLDNLMFEAERAVELLRERRTALISAAVTGKIDVSSEQREVVIGKMDTRVMA